MTKEEIKAIISAKIAGQGNQVDAGGALDTILNAIVDIIPAGYELPIATDETLGGVKVGSRLSITEDGVLSASDQSYSLPAASAETLGGIKVGSNLSITEDGVLSAQGDAEPLIVEGHAIEGEDTFEPNDGQPTFAEAKAAFLAGRVVLLKYTDSADADETRAVYGFNITTTEEQLLINGELLYWAIARQ